MKEGKIKAFKTLFGFDITNFGNVYDNSCMGRLFRLEDAREVKKAYETLKEEFSWKQELSIYKYDNDWYAVECPDNVTGEHEKIEQLKTAPS